MMSRVRFGAVMDEVNIVPLWNYIDKETNRACMISSSGMRSTWPHSSCSRNRFAGMNDVGAKAQLRKIVRVQRDDKVGLSDFCAGAERFIIRVWRNVVAGSVRNFLCLCAD